MENLTISMMNETINLAENIWTKQNSSTSIELFMNKNVILNESLKLNYLETGESKGRSWILIILIILAIVFTLIQCYICYLCGICAVICDTDTYSYRSGRKTAKRYKTER